MRVQNREEVVSIILSAELMMYGSLAVRIDKNGNGIMVSWLTVADGGDVISNEEKGIPQRAFESLVNTVCELEFVDIEDESMNICWSLQLGDKSDNEIFSTSLGYWERALLENIIKEFELFLDDEEVMYDFNELLTW